MPSSNQSTPLPTTNKDCEPLVQKRNECYRKQELSGADQRRDDDTNHIHGSDAKNLHHPSNKKCWIPTLNAKRCLAFVHCAHPASLFYVTPSDDTTTTEGTIDYGRGGTSKGGAPVVSNNKMTGITKGMCASFDEAYCFGNPQLMKIDTSSRDDGKRTAQQRHRQAVFEEHRKAVLRIGNNKQKWRTCQDIKGSLERCLRKSASSAA